MWPRGVQSDRDRPGKESPGDFVSAAVDAKHEELIAAGSLGRRAPFVTSFNAYLGLVDDPDGNTVLVTAG